MLEIVMLAEFRRLALPARPELVHEDNKMGIAHRDRNTSDLAEGDFDRKFLADHRDSHVRAELEMAGIAANQRALFDSRPGANGYGLTAVLRGPVRSNAPRPVARDLRFRSIRVEQPRANVGFAFLIGEQPFHAVGANSGVPVADLAGERRHISWRVQSFDDQEIIAAGRCLGEWNGSGHAYSRSWPRVPTKVTFFTDASVFSLSARDMLSERDPVSPKRTRYSPSAVEISTFSIAM